VVVVVRGVRQFKLILIVALSRSSKHVQDFA
jgi:hypothetical protein